MRPGRGGGEYILAVVLFSDYHCFVRPPFSFPVVVFVSSGMWAHPKCWIPHNDIHYDAMATVV